MFGKSHIQLDSKYAIQAKSAPFLPTYPEKYHREKSTSTKSSSQVDCDAQPGQEIGAVVNSSSVDVDVAAELEIDVTDDVIAVLGIVVDVAGKVVLDFAVEEVGNVKLGVESDVVVDVVVNKVEDIFDCVVVGKGVVVVVEVVAGVVVDNVVNVSEVSPHIAIIVYINCIAL